MCEKKTKYRKCIICGSSKNNRLMGSGKYKGSILCGKHRSQLQRNGKILERTRFDDNTFILKNGYYEIICYGLKGEETGRGYFDEDDYSLISKYKWSMRDRGVLQTRINDKNIKMHLLIMDRVNIDDGMVVDHRDRNPSNNRKKNLYIVNKQENSVNSSMSSRNKSGYIGVFYNKETKNWKAYICKNGKKISKSGFLTKEEAIIQRLSWEYALFGEDIAPQRNLFKKYNIGEDN